jgi:hypothetical protein
VLHITCLSVKSFKLPCSLVRIHPTIVLHGKQMVLDLLTEIIYLHYIYGDTLSNYFRREDCCLLGDRPDDGGSKDL